MGQALVAGRPSALYRASIGVIHGFATRSADCVDISCLNSLGGRDDFPRYLYDDKPFPTSRRRTTDAELRSAQRLDRSKRETTRRGHAPAPDDSRLRLRTLYTDDAPPCDTREGADERSFAAGRVATSHAIPESPSDIRRESLARSSYRPSTGNAVRHGGGLQACRPYRSPPAASGPREPPSFKPERTSS